MEEVVNKKKIFVRLETYGILFMLYNLLAFNTVFFEKVYRESSLLFTIGSFVVLWALGSLCCFILFHKHTVKPLSWLFLLINGSVFYFVKTYNVYIDDEMLRNTLQTNWAETQDLLNWKWAAYILLLGFLPCLLIWRLQFAPKTSVKAKTFLILGLILIAVTPIAVSFQKTAPFVRSHKPLKYQLIPVNYISAVNSMVKKYYRENHEFMEIGRDARFEKYWQNDKKNLLVLIVGETARADHFSFNGYERDTNAPLNGYKQNIINYPHAVSCGTSTAVSLPCMFSRNKRADFVSGSMAYTENLLDVMKRGGYHVVWVENNSDCKDICPRIETLYPCRAYPQEADCLDAVMLPEIGKSMPKEPQNTVIVLHQIGSHGPKYFKRYKPEKAPYLPACNTEKLDECSHEELINVYDNTIDYTSQNIADIIATVAPYKKDYNIMLFYVSDHGESLGENNIYLHSAPYIIAPQEQKDIPFFIWAEDETFAALNLDKECLTDSASEPISHDNFFHSVLSVGGIHTTEYVQDLDLFAKCKK